MTAALRDVQQSIERAQRRRHEKTGRSDPTTLIAVSKTFGIDKIKPILEAGQRVFGESRVHEAKEKWSALKSCYQDVELHLIGRLQSNKVKDAVALFDVIATVDRPKIAAALAEEMKRANRFLQCLVQINTGEEPQKAGVIPGDADSFIKESMTNGLPIVGAMCVPPIDDEPAPHFALLKHIAHRNALPTVSMGMSADYGLAVEMGATHVRVGTAIFGIRPPA